MAAGGVIPPQDYDFLYNTGVCEVFGPGLYFFDFRALRLMNFQFSRGTVNAGKPAAVGKSSFSQHC